MRSSVEPEESEASQVSSVGSRRTSRSGKPKLFQCTGYGDCRMVFTRSEHLARHMRKHTGEKPFKCVVPGCDRMFSRFDNMMQHTQTHSKSRASRRTKQSGSAQKGNKQRELSEHSYDGTMPSPPPSRHNSIQSGLHNNGRHRFSDDEDEDEDDDADSDASYHPPPKSRHNGKEQRVVMAQLRRLSQEEAGYHHHYYPQPPPPPPWWSCYNPGPPSPTAGSTSSIESIESHHRRQRPFAAPTGGGAIISRATPAVHFHPYPPHHHHHHRQQQPRRSIEHDDFMSGRMILPRLANYLVKNPGEPPENYLLHHQSTSPPSSPKIMGTRRLSVQDLCNPIESLEPTLPLQEPEDQGIDLTEDEFQALQGLGRFRLVAMADTKP